MSQAVGPGPTPLVCQHINVSHGTGYFYGDNPLSQSFPLALFQISFVLVSINLLRFLLKPLGQPKIVAEVIGGIIIGPSVLGRSKTFKDLVFPKNSEFMVRNLAVIGYTYFLFVSGVKMDMKLVTTSRRKHLVIALASVIFPMATIYLIGFFYFGPKNVNPIVIPRVSNTIAFAQFPSVFPVLKEINLLSSEVGRTSLTTCIISEAIGICSLLTFDIMRQVKSKNHHGFWFLLVFIWLLGLLYIIRKVMLRIVARSHGGKPIEKGIVIGIIISALIIGFMTDAIGLSMGHGAFFLGLVIPDGPPLGSLVLEKTETIVMDIFMPLFFVTIGMIVDVTNESFQWSMLKPVVVMVLVGCVVKVVATMLASLCFKMPVRDSLAVSLLVNVRGQVELTLFIYWMRKKLIQQSFFAMMVLMITLITGVVTPLVGLLCDPTRPYMIRQRRTIQHTAVGSELSIMMTLEEEHEVSTLVALLEASNPSPAGPFSITALCLIELIGRAVPIFIDHQTRRKVPLQYASCLAIHKALGMYQESRAKSVKLRSYTAISPKRTVYQDICELALLNKTALIILPHDREDLEESGEHRVGVSSVKMHVLSHAPCSVAILVSKGHFITNPLAVSKDSFGPTKHHFAVLFFGGADAREALAYADRMMGNPTVRVTVFRFLALDGEGDDKMENKLDNSMMTWFWVKNENNKRMTYREVTVQNGAQTVAAIEAVKEDSFDLWVVGREQGINPVLLRGLSGGSDEPTELGVIGEYVAADDFRSTASVLVIQQQILRERGSSAVRSGCRRLAKYLRRVWY